jgi:hypothetical protein
MAANSLAAICFGGKRGMDPGVYWINEMTEVGRNESFRSRVRKIKREH